MQGNCDIFPILIKHGADINAITRYCLPLPPLLYPLAISIPHTPIFCLQSSNGHNALHIAVLSENPDIVRKLLDLGLDPKAPTDSQPSAIDFVKHTRNRSKEMCDVFQSTYFPSSSVSLLWVLWILWMLWMLWMLWVLLYRELTRTLPKLVPDERVSLLVLFGPECDASDYADVEKLKACSYSKEEANERDAKGNVPLYYAIKNHSVGAPIIQVRRTPLFLTL